MALIYTFFICNYLSFLCLFGTGAGRIVGSLAIFLDIVDLIIVIKFFPFQFCRRRRHRFISLTSAMSHFT